jgi:hypothetical protein
MILISIVHSYLRIKCHTLTSDTHLPGATPRAPCWADGCFSFLRFSPTRQRRLRLGVLLPQIPDMYLDLEESCYLGSTTGLQDQLGMHTFDLSLV